MSPKLKTEERLGVPSVRESYQEMKGTKDFEDKAAEKERRKEEKEHQHLEHEKAKEYKQHLPPVEKRIMEERPPFNKK